MSTLRVEFIGRADAAKTVTRWHYSKVMPVAPVVCFGAWEDEKYVGCVVFSPGSNRNLGSPYGLSSTECVELVRVALRPRKTPTSKVVGVCLRVLKKHSPGLRLIVSFADPVQGHVGAIYQAMNWMYAGLTPPTFEWRHDGKRLNKRAFTGANFGSARRQLPPGAVKVDVPGKHRYLYPMDESMRKALAHICSPYPKRRPVEGFGDHSRQGGADPTPTLHPAKADIEHE